MSRLQSFAVTRMNIKTVYRHPGMHKLLSYFILHLLSLFPQFSNRPPTKRFPNRLHSYIRVCWSYVSILTAVFKLSVLHSLPQAKQPHVPLLTNCICIWFEWSLKTPGPPMTYTSDIIQVQHKSERTQYALNCRMTWMTSHK